MWVAIVLIYILGNYRHRDNQHLPQGNVRRRKQKIGKDWHNMTSSTVFESQDHSSIQAKEHAGILHPLVLQSFTPPHFAVRFRFKRACIL